MSDGAERGGRLAGDGTKPGAEEVEHHGAHGEIHLPPNSWIPLWVALALMLSLVGILPPLAPWVAIIGAVALAGGLVAWYRSARAEYLELPEADGH